MNVFTFYLKLVCATMFFNITTSNKLIEVYYNFTILMKTFGSQEVGFYHVYVGCILHIIYQWQYISTMTQLHCRSLAKQSN